MRGLRGDATATSSNPCLLDRRSICSLLYTLVAIGVAAVSLLLSPPTRIRIYPRRGSSQFSCVGVKSIEGCTRWRGELSEVAQLVASPHYSDAEEEARLCRSCRREQY